MHHMWNSWNVVKNLWNAKNVRMVMMWARALQWLGWLVVAYAAASLVAWIHRRRKHRAVDLQRFYRGKVVWLTGASSGLGEGAWIDPQLSSLSLFAVGRSYK